MAELTDILSQVGGQNLPPELTKMLVMELLKQQIQQGEPLYQAKVAGAQQKVAPPRGITEILGGTGSQAQPQGSSMFMFSGAGEEAGLTPDERIRTIIDYLSQGEAPPEAAVGPMTSQALAPAPGAAPGQPFRFAGYEDIGFDPRTRAFTNIGIPTAVPVKPTAPQVLNPTAIAKHAEIVQNLTKSGYTSTQAGQIADQAVPEVAQLQQRERLKAKTEEKEAQVDIQRRVQREKFVLENQSNLFKKGTGEPLMLAPEQEIGDTETILKNYVPLKPENAKDKRQLDGVALYAQSFKDLLVDIKPLLTPTQKGVKGITERLKAGTGVAYLRVQGDPRIRELDALKAQITQLARGFGGDARVSDQEMIRLDKALFTGWDTQEGAEATLKILDSFVKNRGIALGFNKYVLPGKARPEGKNILQGKDADGRAIISRDNGLNWEYK